MALAGAVNNQINYENLYAEECRITHSPLDHFSES